MIVMPPVFNSGDTIYFFFDSYDSNGASVTISGLAVTDIEVYKNGSVTQRSSDNGYALLDTDGIDFDGATGLHGFSIDTSDNSDAGFWADGAQYLVHVNAVTIDSQTVRFSYLLTLGYLLRPTTAGRKLDVSSGGEAGVDWANVGSPTTTLNLSGTTVSVATSVTNMVTANVTQVSGDSTAADNLETAFDGGSYNVGGGGVVAASVTGAVGSVTGNVGGNIAGSVAGSVASVTAVVNANITKVNNVTVGGVGSEADPWNPA